MIFEKEGNALHFIGGFTDLCERFNEE